MLVSKDHAFKDRTSVPRNGILLSMLNAIGIGDRQGWGIPTMVELLKNEGYQSLTFKENTCPDRTTLFLPISSKSKTFLK